MTPKKPLRPCQFFSVRIKNQVYSSPPATLRERIESELIRLKEQRQHIKFIDL